MPRYGNGQFRDAVLRKVAYLTQFCEIHLPSGTLYLSPNPMDISWNGHLWVGTRGLGAISQVTESPHQIAGIELTLSGVNPANLAEALDPTIRGSNVILYDVQLTSDYQVVPNPIIFWQGYIDRPAISVDAGTATITVPCEHISMRNKLPRTWRYTHEDQQALYPADGSNAEDRGFEYVTQMVERTVVWPAKAFFEAQARAAG